MSKQKKIGLIIPHLQSGGAERVLAVTSQLLSREGYDVYFIMFDTENISFEFSGKLIDLRSKSKSNIISKISARLSRIIKLSYYSQKYKFNYIISFLYSANVVNYYSISKTKKIIACRGYSDFVRNGNKYSKMLKNIEGIIVQTERMKSDFIKYYQLNSSKINVVRNPFNIEEIQKKSREEIENNIQNFISNHTTICTMGSFKRDKGYWHLIRSFVKVKQSIENAGLLFIGHRGEMEDQIKDMAQRSGYEKDILFIGHQENPFKYISKCTLYVSSSLNEGFPNVLIEAMACGVPVISTDCKTGPREIISDVNLNNKTTKALHCTYGVLTKEFSEKVNFDFDEFEEEEIDMANEIIDLLGDQQLIKKYSEASIVRAKMFGVDTYLNKLHEIIN